MFTASFLAAPPSNAHAFLVAQDEHMKLLALNAANLSDIEITGCSSITGVA